MGKEVLRGGASLKLLGEKLINSHIIFLVPTGPPLLNESLQTAEERQLHLQWHAPEPQHQNGVIINYTICIEREDSMEDCRLYYTSSTNMIVTGLHPYTVYRYKVAARTSVGRGNYTEQLSIQTLEDGE